MGPEVRFQGSSQNSDDVEQHFLLSRYQHLFDYLILNSAAFVVPSTLFMLEQLSELLQCDFTISIGVQLGHQGLCFLL